MKCKSYSEITVEIRTQLKTVKITSNIFAVYTGNTCYLIIFNETLFDFRFRGTGNFSKALIFKLYLAYLEALL